VGGQGHAKDLGGWTEALFKRKVAQLASIIRQMKNAAGPDVLGVCEVENQFALQALADALNEALPARRYELVHVDAVREQRGIDTAFLFDAKQLTANRDELFSHWVMRRTGTRDITQITFVTASGKQIVALANHWPSRSSSAGEGPEYSAGFRATAGETSLTGMTVFAKKRAMMWRLLPWVISMMIHSINRSPFMPKEIAIKGMCSARKVPSFITSPGIT
jgi:predicted extracellular nuclease